MPTEHLENYEDIFVAHDFDGRVSECFWCEKSFTENEQIMVCQFRVKSSSWTNQKWDYIADFYHMACWEDSENKIKK